MSVPRSVPETAAGAGGLPCPERQHRETPHQSGPTGVRSAVWGHRAAGDGQFLLAGVAAGRAAAARRAGGAVLSDDGAAGAGRWRVCGSIFQLWEPVSGQGQRPAAGDAHPAVDAFCCPNERAVRDVPVLSAAALGPGRSSVWAVCGFSAGRAAECSPHGAGAGRGSVPSGCAAGVGGRSLHCAGRTQNAGHDCGNPGACGGVCSRLPTGNGSA